MVELSIMASNKPGDSPISLHEIEEEKRQLAIRMMAIDNYIFSTVIGIANTNTIITTSE